MKIGEKVVQISDDLNSVDYAIAFIMGMRDHGYVGTLMIRCQRMPNQRGESFTVVRPFEDERDNQLERPYAADYDPEYQHDWIAWVIRRCLLDDTGRPVDAGGNN